MNRFVATIVHLVLITNIFAMSVDDVPDVHRADKNRFVSNPDGILSSQAEAQLNAAIGAIWKETSAEVTLVVIDNLDGTDINTFATELFDKWTVGKADKDNGVLILVSKADRKAAIRTGYGVEGVLPDIICGRIIRDDMVPQFKSGNYEAGSLAAIEKIHALLTDPDAVQEIRSAHANDALRIKTTDDDADLWSLIFTVAMFGFLISFALYCYIIFSSRKLSPVLRYNQLQKMRIPVLLLVVFGLGTPLLFYWLLGRKMKRVRDKSRPCANCGTTMIKMDEVADNAYLTPAQDTEERLNSVDYDVWVCPNCNETDIIPFDNPNSPYTVCPVCGSKACSVIEDRIVVPPTTRSRGKGMRVYSCKNCGNRHNKYYDIAQKPEVPPVIFIPGAGIGGSGGGFSGGNFGGGRTGGGGASGGW